MTVRYGDIKPTFGSGGSNLAPQGASGVPSLRDTLQAALGAVGAAYADATALTASLAADRVDGQVVIKLDDYTPWVWQAGSSAGASSTVIVPTDVGSGAGRWVAEGGSVASSAATSLTTRVSTEESTRAADVTSLTTRISTAESTETALSTSLSSSLASLNTRLSTIESTEAAVH